ncbi:putative type III restriction/modification system modification methylase [Streptococcus pneumoniae]|nr:site-specific DNA-methyltransferase [Streptococcus pneumoniae]MDS5043541.1 site-specific DNA-methyltransferase [Streptococcus pneumoniae]MDS5124677.1 site-specific DNA-methyltransferase [Streptococcus pneumoniae]MDS5623288.1 site-specific DNA-methyltransferase [Streptococcus pneumoniae]MDS8956945.1 site-specific DNA-methyltransferase [Streptococcus pneumoniae]
MDKNIFEIVEDVLKTREKYVSEDNKLLKAIVYSDVMTMNNELLTLLLSNEQIKERFFENVNGTLVFDKQKFAWFIESKEFLPDSYTRYTNKIGLTHNGDFISKSNDVVLDFPYKDCVLEGGQDKDDQKRKEIFYNETIASDEITKMLAPKVFTNAKRYTKDGIEENIAFDENDNLIVKGNNLIVLSSLLKKYEGQVKCIYIDPPYYFSVKKDEDTFAYNSNFKLSSWLVFMKNRLEIAKRLLSDDGALFVQISDDGVAELHCLLKDIFGVENFINKITVKTKSPSGFASVNPGVFETAEYILAFAKNKRNWKYNIQYVESGYDTNYKSVVVNKNDPAEKWIIRNIVDVLAEERGYDNAKSIRDALGKVVVNELISEYALNNADSVFRYTAIGNNAGQIVVDIRNKSREEPEKIFTVKRDGQYTVYIHKGQEIAFYSKKLHEVDGKIVPSMQVSNIWIDTPYEGIANEGGVTLKGGKKPEKLIRRIIEMASNRGDLILDYHLGSGTTCAVAHKTGRRYIGIEQMDYIQDMTVERMKKVIEGEQGGISKSVNWNGGGYFVYCELLENANTLIYIIKSTTEDSILEVKNAIFSDERIVPYITREELNKADAEFENLSFEEKKKSLISLVDKNKLYVNYSDMDDQTFNVTEEDKRFTKSFYEEV